MQNKKGAPLSHQPLPCSVIYGKLPDNAAVQKGVATAKGDSGQRGHHMQNYENACDKESVGKCENISTEI